MHVRKVDLHVHLLQSLMVEDLFELAKDVYNDINWNRFGFLDRYESYFGVRLDPVKVFDKAIATGDLSEIKAICVYQYSPEGNFEAFDIKSFFPLCITGYYFDNDQPEIVLKYIVNRHKKEGIRYIEYRNGFGGGGQIWKDWHARFARFLKHASTDQFQAKYIVRLGDYVEFKEMMQENPDVVDTIVGVDFSGREISPVRLKSFYEQIKIDRHQNPESTPDVVVHIGENFNDISLESAIRRVHQSALFGAKRLAHCIVLGLDPSIAIKRQQSTHEHESVEERLDQIQYDLDHSQSLAGFGIYVDKDALIKEKSNLDGIKNKDQLVYRAYSIERLQEVKKRQDFVLSELSRLDKIIEICPTSNLCIGGIPTLKDHSFIKLYASDVPIVICTDDPGIFDQTLSDEIDFVISEFGISEHDLVKRLGNPLDYRLKK